MEDKKICWKCKGIIDGVDEYCRFCGKKQDEKAKFTYTVFGVVFMFFVIGPFCLLNLWSSPIIEKNTKKTVSVIIIGISAALVFFMFYAISVIINYYVRMLNL